MPFGVSFLSMSAVGGRPMNRMSRPDGRRARLWATAISSVCLFWLSALRAEPLTVVGFNVESGDASDLVIGLQLSQSRGIDIWALGDVWPAGGWVEQMRDAAQEAEGREYGVLVGETGGADRLMLLYRNDRLVLLDHEELLTARASKREAAPLVARMQLAGETEFLLVLVRLSDSDRRRREQTGALADWASRQRLPVVAAGTFSFGLAEGDDPDTDMRQFLEASGWRWLRPEVDRETSCGGGGRVDDFILIGGAATGWNGRSEVMFPQNNYCPDDGRTSSHRPVQARFATGGGSLEIEAGMAERQALPLMPGEVQRAEDETEDRDEEIQALRRRVEELEAGQRSQARPPESSVPLTQPAGASPPAPRVSTPLLIDRTESIGPAPASPDAAGPDETTSAVAREADVEATAGPLAADSVDQAALRQRLEALEEEVRELRELLEQSSN